MPPDKSAGNRQALADAKARGVRLGRPPEDRPEVRDLIVKMRDKGETPSATAKYLNLNLSRYPPLTKRGKKWYPSTVRAVLRTYELDVDAAVRAEETKMRAEEPDPKKTEKRIGGLRGMVRSARETRRQLARARGHLAHLEERSGAVASLISKVVTLGQEALDAATAVEQNVRKDRQELYEQKAKMERELVKKRNEIIVLEGKVEAARRGTDGARRKLSAANKKVTERTEQLRQAGVRGPDLLKQLSGLETEATTMSAGLVECELLLGDYETRCGVARVAYGELRKRYTQVRAMCIDIEQRYDEIRIASGAARRAKAESSNAGGFAKKTHSFAESAADESGAIRRSRESTRGRKE